MYVASSETAPTHPGYQPRPEEVQMLNLTPVIPPEVVLAMRFVEQCNKVTEPRPYYLSMDGEPIESGMYDPELHPCQEAAMRRALVRLGRYFDGRGPRRQNTHSQEV